MRSSWRIRVTGVTGVTGSGSVPESKAYSIWNGPIAVLEWFFHVLYIGS